MKILIIYSFLILFQACGNKLLVNSKYPFNYNKDIVRGNYKNLIVYEINNNYIWNGNSDTSIIQNDIYNENDSVIIRKNYTDSEDGDSFILYNYNSAGKPIYKTTTKNNNSIEFEYFYDDSNGNEIS